MTPQRTQRGQIAIGAGDVAAARRIGLVVALVAALLVAVALLAWGRDRAALWVYNGFGESVVVVLGEGRFTLEPGGVLFAGAYPREPLALTVTPQGWAGPLEQGEIDPGAVVGDRLLINLAGRAALMRGWIRYGPGLVPEDELVGTASLLAVDGVDHLLTPAPESKVLGDEGSELDELIFDLETALPFSLAAHYTLELAGPEEAWSMLRARLLEAPGDRDAFALACGVHPPGSPELLAVAERARWGRPDSLEAHRLYQRSLGADGIEAARAEYLAMLADHPDSAMHHYLAGRLHEDEALLNRALELDPELSPTHHALAVLWADRGELDTALETYAAYAASSPEAFDAVLRSRVRLLRIQARAGWLDQASELIEQAQKRAPDPAAAGLGAALALEQGQLDLDGAMAVLEASVTGLGMPADDPALLPVRVDLQLAAGEIEAVEATLRSLDKERFAWVLAHGELFLALGEGDREALGRVLDRHGQTFGSTASLQALLAAAAAQALEHPSAPALRARVEGLARPGGVGPSVVLEPGLELESAKDLDALLAAVPLDGRGLGYAAAAVLLEHGGGDAILLGHARERAAALMLPDERPPW